MSQDITLTAHARERVGKGASRALRREGLVPAIIYGDKKDPLPVALPYKELSILLHSGGFLTTVFNLDVDGKTHRVLPKDYQLEPVRDFIAHVDFLRISRDAVVTVEIPVVFINEDTSPGLVRGGVLNVVRYTIELTCPAESIPENLTADLAGLDIGDSLHISAFEIPEGATLTISDRDFTVATIAAPAVLVDDEDEDTDETVEGMEGEEGEGEEGEDEGTEE